MRYWVSMTGEWGNKRWFVALVMDQQPVEIIDWGTWVALPLPNRLWDAGRLVIAKDYLDAYSKALRGEYAD